MDNPFHCIRRFFQKKKEESPEKCPDFIPDKDDVFYVDPDQWDELNDRNCFLFDEAIKHPAALNNARAFYETCYLKPSFAHRPYIWDDELA
tara:strand:- start:452 stop:724 length:273 start_codon:yes stop_codon:yes gene_type:complete